MTQEKTEDNKYEKYRENIQEVWPDNEPVPYWARHAQITDDRGQALKVLTTQSWQRSYYSQEVTWRARAGEGFFSEHGKILLSFAPDARLAQKIPTYILIRPRRYYSDTQFSSFRDNDLCLVGEPGGMFRGAALAGDLRTLSRAMGGLGDLTLASYMTWWKDRSLPHPASDNRAYLEAVENSRHALLEAQTNVRLHKNTLARALEELRATRRTGDVFTQERGPLTWLRNNLCTARESAFHELFVEPGVLMIQAFNDTSILITMRHPDTGEVSRLTPSIDMMLRSNSSGASINLRDRGIWMRGGNSISIDPALLSAFMPIRIGPPQQIISSIFARQAAIRDLILEQARPDQEETEGESQ